MLSFRNIEIFSDAHLHVCIVMLLTALCICKVEYYILLLVFLVIDVINIFYACHILTFLTFFLIFRVLSLKTYI